MLETSSGTGAGTQDGGRTNGHHSGAKPESVDPRAGAWQRRPPPVAGSEAAAVMRGFHQVMERFLQTQENVLLAYLTQRGALAPGTGRVVPQLEAGTPLAPPPGRGTNGAEASALQAPAPPDPPAPLAQPEGVDGVGERPTEPVPPPRASTPAPPSPAPADGQALGQRVLAVVSERTGYPVEMLDLDANLEADLGIDSIKKVEIAGTMVQQLELSLDDPSQMEKLATSVSLREVIASLEALVARPRGEPRQEPTGGEDPNRPFDQGLDEPAIRRFTIKPVHTPFTGEPAGLARPGAVVIVDDGLGIGEHLAQLLKGRGHTAVRVLPPSHASHAARGALTADVSRPDEVARLVAQLRADHGPLAALVHLTALRPGRDDPGFDPQRWRRQLAGDLRPLFLLAQALQPDLERAAAAGGAAVLSATALGGAFACDGLPEALFPGQAGISGFVKTLAREWPTVRAKVVDVWPAPPSAVARALLVELLAGDGIVEVGYRDGARTLLDVVPTPLSPRGVAIALDEDAIILVTGGARGITAETAIRLAERYRCTLLLVGRTPLVSEPEPPELAEQSDPRALKAAIIERQRRAGLAVAPATVEEVYRRLTREREVRATLARLQRSGARVEYISCDVRDAAAFGAVVDDIYRRYGRIDGVLHGAGIIEDKLIRDKQLESFERVLDTKVSSVVTLAAKLRLDALRFLVFFSSVSGRFGNRGQGDYAAASEILNKLAQRLDRLSPARVVSINWGPWLNTGMVSPEVRRQFAERGVALIPPELGCRKLDEELRLGRKGEVEVLIGGVSRQVLVAAPSERSSTASARTQSRDGAASSALPMLQVQTTVSQDASGRHEIVRTLDLEHDRYLGDHRIDGRPVMPLAAALELMAEAATAVHPGLEIAEVRGLCVLQGIILKGEAQSVRLVIRPLGQTTYASTAPAPPPGARAVDVTIVSEEALRRAHYHAVVVLAQLPADAPWRGRLERAVGDRPLGRAGPLPMSVEQAYGTWLFHGPLFQRIRSIEAIGPQGARALLLPSSPAECLGGNPSGDWVVDPGLIDAALQLQVIWARLHWDVTLLAAGFEAYYRFGSAHAGPLHGGEMSAIRYDLRIRPESRAPMCGADHYFWGPDGRLLAAIANAQGTGSRALNRLAGSASP